MPKLCPKELVNRMILDLQQLRHHHRFFGTDQCAFHWQLHMPQTKFDTSCGLNSFISFMTDTSSPILWNNPGCFSLAVAYAQTMFDISCGLNSFRSFMAKTLSAIQLSNLLPSSNLGSYSSKACAYAMFDKQRASKCCYCCFEVFANS